jgi:hypothetical protein
MTGPATVRFLQGARTIIVTLQRTDRASDADVQFTKPLARPERLLDGPSPLEPPPGGSATAGLRSRTRASRCSAARVRYPDGAEKQACHEVVDAPRKHDRPPAAGPPSAASFPALRSTQRAFKKKMKDPTFARGVDRDEVVHGADLLGVDLDDRIRKVIEAMQGIAGELGLARS